MAFANCELLYQTRGPRRNLSLDDLTSDSELPWKTPEFLSLNDLIVYDGSDTHIFKAMDVLSLPKNRHATCRKHKDKMIRQLRELVRSEPTCLKFEDIDVGFHFLSPDLFPTLELESEIKWLDQQDDDFPYGSLLRNLSESDKKPENMNQYSSVVSTSASSNHEINNSLERNSAFSRYKEKKKSRRYKKHIRRLAPHQTPIYLSSVFS